MTLPIIQFENVGKRYKVGSKEPYYSLRDNIAGLFRRHQKSDKGYFWALNDINLKINQGETIGIIGKNGAGKSTLLKVLSQITPPTKGKIKVNGRIASLLEVGTGFHPELSGRENIFLNGAILGMTQREIKRKLNEIVAFSEIEKFLDTPVKRYSSGMYVRLAFAVAAHLEPEILVVDEVLAVGDAQFQKKCLGKMEEVGKKEGRTILFVSHNMGAVSRLCPKSILLESGRIIEHGNTDGVIAKYLGSDKSNNMKLTWPDLATAPGDQVVKLILAGINSKDKAFGGVVDISDAFEITIEYAVQTKDLVISPVCRITNQEGVAVFQINDWNNQKTAPGRYRATLPVPANLLNEGMYYVSIIVNTPPKEKHIEEFDLLSFYCTDKNLDTETRKVWAGNIPGVIRPAIKWKNEKIT